MSSQADAIHSYILAKDGNRPWLMHRAFAVNARLEMVVKTDAISFPAAAIGIDAITDVLVCRFSSDQENVYTLCPSSPPEFGRRQFSCDWLVGISRRDNGDVRVGSGRYDWFFADLDPSRVSSLKITIEVMEVLPPEHLHPVMRWLSRLSYPWCSTDDAIRDMPRLDPLRKVADYLYQRK